MAPYNPRGMGWDKSFTPTIPGQEREGNESRELDTRKAKGQGQAGSKGGGSRRRRRKVGGTDYCNGDGSTTRKGSVAQGPEGGKQGEQGELGKRGVHSLDTRTQHGIFICISTSISLLFTGACSLTSGKTANGGF